MHSAQRLLLADLLSLPRDDAVKAAHYAEVQLRTGLGDVIASSFGGIEIRREAGLPPWGMLEHIPGIYDMVVCVIGKEIETKKILSDAARLSEIAIVSDGIVQKNCSRSLLLNTFFLLRGSLPGRLALLMIWCFRQLRLRTSMGWRVCAC